eukprot:94745_1
MTWFGNSPGISVNEGYEGDKENEGSGKFIRSIIKVLQNISGTVNTCKISDLLTNVSDELSNISNKQQIPYKNGDIVMDGLTLSWNKSDQHKLCLKPNNHVIKSKTGTFYKNIVGNGLYQNKVLSEIILKTDEKDEEEAKVNANVLTHLPGDVIAYYCKEDKTILLTQIETIIGQKMNYYKVDLPNMISNQIIQKEYSTPVEYKTGYTPPKYARFQGEISEILKPFWVHYYNEIMISMDDIIGTPLCIRKDVNRNWIQITIRNASHYHPMLIQKPYFLNGQLFRYPNKFTIRNKDNKSIKFVEFCNSKEDESINSKMLYGISTSSKWQCHDFDDKDSIYVSPNTDITFYVRGNEDEKSVFDYDDSKNADDDNKSMQYHNNTNSAANMPWLGDIVGCFKVNTPDVYEIED